MRNQSRLGITVASVVAAALALTACGSSGDSDGGGNAETKPAESVTWMTMLHTPTTPEADGPIQTALEEYTGTKLDIQWVPDASKDEKINAALASDSLADITSITNTSNTSVRQALKSGQFWDVEKYLKDYPNLSKIDEQTIASARVDGHLYGVPFQKPMARYGVLVRQDWLDNLGLEAPHTIEELGDVAVAFATQDPDGNGQDDTTGFIDRLESFKLGFKTLAGYFGAGNNWEITDDDEVVPAFQTDEFKDAMEWYRGLYEQGAVNSEFVTMQKQNQQDAIAQGKGGIVVTGLFEAKNYMNLALSADPNTPMAWALINDITFDDVPRRILSDTGGGFGGWLAMSTTQVKDEAELKSILAFIDKLLDEEAYALMTNGIEGEHYTVDDDGVVTITDQATWEQEVQPYNSSRPSDIVTTFKSSSPYVDEGNEKIAENAEFAVVDPTQPLSSVTFDQSWSTIQQAANDAYNKYMVGQLDMDGYEDAIDALGSQGLDKMIEEFTASYAESK
ncbi:Lipoprotein LipO precursor [Microbacterium hydrocarbonoxydans]|uniref:Lipoprotein LipO n=1 Tax=Microbacterium hydrocarbonoxydans TaxID=273678 RepID=A0A0M2HRT4_9MICO|nr:extracellular solute-binding protein [Microbacterium hydrocarbonoxydans]KJL47188.1 Lipoprotein LipO precursor [Microbacterium hydrocarbonoxydans]